MDLFELFKDAMRYKKVYHNYLHVMYRLRRIEPEVNVVLNTGQQKLLSRRIAMALPYFGERYQEQKEISEILELLEKEIIRYKNCDIILHGLRDYGDVGGVFVRDEYSFLRVAGKTVIDIGANIGDSSIYFMLNAAESVVAVEPSKELLRFAYRNVAENGFHNKIVLVNGLYGEEENPAIKSNKKEIESKLVDCTDSGNKARTYSLEELLNLQSSNTAILKMDCEGCEYGLVTEKDDILRKFERMQIEFHGSPHLLVTRLEEVGFKVRFERNPAIRRLGYVYAELGN